MQATDKSLEHSARKILNQSLLPYQSGKSSVGMIQSNKQKCFQLISATGYERKLQGENNIMAMITVNMTTVVTWTTLLLQLIVFFKKYH